jgi:hypothetical protein
MRLAHLVPTAYLPAIQYGPQFDTHLALSRLVVRDPQYYSFYRDRVVRGHTVFLDNPVHEDAGVSLIEWLTAIDILQPTVAILPDQIDAPEMTVQWAKRAITYLEERNLGKVTLMAVPHGESHEDWLDCAMQLVEIPKVRWIGISLERRLKDDPLACERRLFRLKLLQDKVKEKIVPIHFLGISEAASELNDPRARAVYSADASKFAVWCLLGMPQQPPVPLTSPYPGRDKLGGSLEYFDYGGNEDFAMTANLARWCDYAREIV